MDNLSVKAKKLIESVGAKAKFLPPYSNRVVLREVKRIVHRAKARTVEAVDGAISAAVDVITGENTLSGFEHCGIYIYFDALQQLML